MSDSKRKRGRPKTGSPDTVILPVRVHETLADRIDALAASYGINDLGHPNVTRSQLMRRYLEEGVTAHEAERSNAS